MDEIEGESAMLETHQGLFKIMEALNRVSNDSQMSQDSPGSDSSTTIKDLLELRSASSSILSLNPHLLTLSQNLSLLADLVQKLLNSKPSNHGIQSFLIHRVKSHEISRLANSIESELQGLINRETVSSLRKTIEEIRCSSDDFSSSFDEHQLLDKMFVFRDRLSRGFNINLQDLLLKSGIFAELEWVLCNPLFPKRVRENAAIAVKDLVLFNKDVFVGSVLVGGSVKALAWMDSLCSLQVISSLVKAIRSPLVDEIESCGGIFKIVGYLSSKDLEMKMVTMDCILEIGYFGRNEAVEAMINGGLIKKLVELQRLEMMGVDLIFDTLAKGGEERDWQSKRHHFKSCVARFAVQLEVGEGLRQREKRAFKQQILCKVREACVSDAECGTIVAEVLWGSSP